MEPFIIINPESTGIYYSVFYLWSFLIGFVLLVFEGRKRKFPVIPWMLVITTVFLFFLFGVQAIRFSKEDWQLVFQFKGLTSDPGRSVIGGILFAVPGLFIARYFLKFRFDLLDAFAFVAPVGMFFQRLGCFLAGCCFGTPTTMPWGAQYGITSHALDRHLHDGLVSHGSNLSIPVHPVPLYEMVCCVFIVLTLLRLKNYLRVPGNLLFASVCLYGIGRFITEIYRSTTIGIHTPTGLTFLQLGILVLIPLVIGLILYRENRFNYSGTRQRSEPISDKLAVIYFFFITVLFLIVSRWLTSLEILTLNIVLAPTLLFVGWHVFKSFTVPGFRFATVCLIGGSFMMMSQTLPEKSRSDSTKLSYNIFSMGLSGSESSFLLVDFDNTTTDCNGNPTSGPVHYYVDNASRTYGFGFSRVEQRNLENVIQYGLDGYWGTNSENSSGTEGRSTNIFGLHPFVQYDMKTVGLGVGFHAGNLTKVQSPETSADGSSITTVKKMNFFPSFYLRVGNTNKVFLETKVAQQFPSPFPALGFQANVGFGFPKKKRGGAIRIGTASNAGLFVAPSFHLGPDLIVEPFLGVLPHLFNEKTSDHVFEEINQESNFVGALSLRFKFGRKERPMN